MKQSFKFYREQGQWYIDLPEYIETGAGTQGDLAMVAGADTWLDFLDPLETGEVILEISDGPFDGAEMMESCQVEGLHNEVEGIGQTYIIETYAGEKVDHLLWLCPVCEWVFEGYPDKIYFK